MKIERFEDIEAWQLARELCQKVNSVISIGEFSRNYSLKDQIDRASGSVMDNIAEGFDGGGRAEFAKFLSYAQRSCSEVKSQLYRALDRNYISNQEFQDLYKLASSAHSKIGGFIHYLKNCK